MTKRRFHNLNTSNSTTTKLTGGAKPSQTPPKLAGGAKPPQTLPNLAGGAPPPRPLRSGWGGSAPPDLPATEKKFGGRDEIEWNFNENLGFRRKSRISVKISDFGENLGFRRKS